MKESDYIKATNLAKAMAARALLAEIQLELLDAKTPGQYGFRASAIDDIDALIRLMRAKIRIAGDK